MAGYTLRARHLKYFYFIAIAGSLFILLRSRAKSVQRSLPVEAPTHKVLIWDVGKRMERRFLRSFGSSNKDPFEFCTVRNCVLETSNDKIDEAAAVFFHLHMTKGPETQPKFHRPDQLWIFFTDESPLHTFMATKKYKMSDYNGIFNLSMTYRSDSDIPAAYGRTVELSEVEKANMADLPNYAASRHRMVAILGQQLRRSQQTLAVRQRACQAHERRHLRRMRDQDVPGTLYAGLRRHEGLQVLPGVREQQLPRVHHGEAVVERLRKRRYCPWSWVGLKKTILACALPIPSSTSKTLKVRVTLAEYLKFLDSKSHGVQLVL
uniref:Putative fucosyltransferase n=2 Tax=Ixodes ricinus TaxID=34613 RepID=A0A090XCG7_IXORI